MISKMVIEAVTVSLLRVSAFISFSLSLGIIAHLIGESCINLLLQLLLDIRVSGQNMQKEGKSTASGLIASKNKDNTLGHEFLVRESLKKKKKK